MSGGHFDYGYHPENLDGQWRDEEIDELYHDLFCGGDFAVRDHGGLDSVKRRWECLSYYADPVPRSCMEKRLARLQRQIDESHAALRRRNERIKELNHRACDLTRENAELRKRAMPEGMCWPVFEDGEPVRPGDRLLDKGGDWFEAGSFVFTCDWWSVRGYQTEGFGDLNDETRRKLEGMAYGTCVKRPAPKVLDADGVEIHVGDTVWATNGHGPFEVTRTVYADRLRVICDDEKNGHLNVYPEMLTHQRPVLDADGVEIREGDEVWDVDGSGPFIVSGFVGEPLAVIFEIAECNDLPRKPSQLTHRAPVLAADGRPLSVGEHVYHVETGAELVVKELPKPGEYQAVVVFALPTSPASHLTSFDPDRLTHERPESWDRLEEDATMSAATYCERMGIEVEEGHSFVEPMARDLVRRARALAERERGE